MIDPLTAFAAVKGGIAAGKQIHSMSKEIVGFFDSVDAAKKEHTKKSLASLLRQTRRRWTHGCGNSKRLTQRRSFVS